MWEIFIEKRLYPTYVLEFITALAGIFYLMNTRSVQKADKFLVYTLIFLFVADLFGMMYALYGYVHNFRFFEFLIGIIVMINCRGHTQTEFAHKIIITQ